MTCFYEVSHVSTWLEKFGNLTKPIFACVKRASSQMKKLTQEKMKVESAICVTGHGGYNVDTGPNLGLRTQVLFG